MSSSRKKGESNKAIADRAKEMFAEVMSDEYEEECKRELGHAGVFVPAAVLGAARAMLLKIVKNEDV